MNEQWKYTTAREYRQAMNRFYAEQKQQQTETFTFIAYWEDKENPPIPADPHMPISTILLGLN